MTDPKETFFFHRHETAEAFERSLEKEYLTHYRGEEVIGEGTTKTMYRTSALGMIRDISPDAKFICLLRNPIERAWSHYIYRVQHQRRPPTKTFSEVIRNEKHDENKALEVGIVELGRYWTYVRRLAEQFAAERIHIILSSDLFDDPNTQMAETFRFLGVDSSVKLDFGEIHNASSYPGSPSLYRTLYSAWKPIKKSLPKALRKAINKPVQQVRSLLLKTGPKKLAMDPADRQYLQELYREPNRRLEEWLDRDLLHWT